MNNYEIMFIVKATIDSDQIKKTSDMLKKIIEDYKSKIIEFKELGEKKLAYPIKKEMNGYYFLMEIAGTKEAISEFDRKSLLDENVLRHLIIKLDEE